MPTPVPALVPTPPRASVVSFESCVLLDDRKPASAPTFPSPRRDGRKLQQQLAQQTQKKKWPKSVIKIDQQTHSFGSHFPPPPTPTNTPFRASDTSVVLVLVGVVCSVAAVVAICIYAVYHSSAGSESGEHFEALQVLLADILPPPCYAINFYLKSLVLPAADEATRRRIQDDMHVREQDLLDRINYWSFTFTDAESDFDPGLREWVSRIAVSAADLLLVYHTMLAPALAANNDTAIGMARDAMTAKWSVHDEVVWDVNALTDADLKACDADYTAELTHIFVSIVASSAVLLLAFLVVVPMFHPQYQQICPRRLQLTRICKARWFLRAQNGVNKRFEFINFLRVATLVVMTIIAAIAYMEWTRDLPDIADRCTTLRDWRADILPPDSYLVTAMMQVAQSVVNAQPVDLAQWTTSIDTLERRYSYWASRPQVQSDYLSESLMTDCVGTGRQLDQHIHHKLLQVTTHQQALSSLIDMYIVFEDHTRGIERSAHYIRKEILLARRHVENLFRLDRILLIIATIGAAAAFCTFTFILSHSNQPLASNLMVTFKSTDELKRHVGSYSSAHSPFYTKLTVQIACWVILMALNFFVALLPLRHLAKVEDIGLFVMSSNRLATLSSLSLHLAREASLDDGLSGMDGVHLARQARSRLFEARKLLVAFRKGGDFRLGDGTDDLYPEIDRIMYDPAPPSDYPNSSLQYLGAATGITMFDGGLAHTYLATVSALYDITETLEQNKLIEAKRSVQGPSSSPPPLSWEPAGELTGLPVEHGVELISLFRHVRPYFVKVWTRVDDELTVTFERLFESVHTENRMLFAFDVLFTLACFFWFMFRKVVHHIHEEIATARLFISLTPFDTLPGVVAQTISEMFATGTVEEVQQSSLFERLGGSEAVSGVVSAAARRSERSGHPALYERMGGQDSIEKFVASLYAAIVEDPTLAPLFTTTDLNKQHRMLVAFVTSLVSEGAYSSRTLQNAHKGLGLTQEHLDIFFDICNEALKKAGASPDVVDEVMTIMHGYERDIIDPRFKQTTPA